MVNWSVNWYGSVNTSPADSPRSLISPRIDQHRTQNYFLHRRRHQQLWNRSNHWICWWRQDRDFSDGPAAT